MRSDRDGEDRESDGLFRSDDASRRYDRDVSDEIEFHLAQQTADLESAGWSLEAARSEARRRFGNAGTVASVLHGIARRRRGRMRRAALIDEARAHFAFALRQMRKRPGFAATTVLLLGVGIGLASATFAIADAALLRPLPFGEPERLVYLQDVREEEGVGYPASLPELRDWTEGAGFLAAVAGVAGNSMVLGGDEPTEVNVGWVTGDWVGVVGEAGDPTTLATVSLTLGAVALAALLAASWRAARTPPALAVRS